MAGTTCPRAAPTSAVMLSGRKGPGGKQGLFEGRGGRAQAQAPGRCWHLGLPLCTPTPPEGWAAESLREAPGLGSLGQETKTESGSWRKRKNLDTESMGRIPPISSTNHHHTRSKGGRERALRRGVFGWTWCTDLEKREQLQTWVEVGAQSGSSHSSPGAMRW